jgi:predicted dehydrogenase
MMFIPTVINLISQVEKGNIGSVLEVNIIAMTRDNAIIAREQPEHWYNQMPGGVFSEIAAHAIYLIQAFLGVVELVLLYRKDNEQTCAAPSNIYSVILQGKSGIGTITWSGPTTTSKVVIDVIGTLKNIRVDIGNATMFEYGMCSTGNASIALENLRQSCSILIHSAGAAFDVIFRRRQSGHFYIIRDSIKSVREGNDPPISIEKAREVVKIFETIGRIEAISKVS